MFSYARPNWGDGESHGRTDRLREACEALRIGRTKFYELLADKKLKAVALGGKTLVARVEVERFLAELPPIRLQADRGDEAANENEK